MDTCEGRAHNYEGGCTHERVDGACGHRAHMRVGEHMRGCVDTGHI